MTPPTELESIGEVLVAVEVAPPDPVEAAGAWDMPYSEGGWVNDPCPFCGTKERVVIGAVVVAVETFWVVEGLGLLDANG